MEHNCMPYTVYRETLTKGKFDESGTNRQQKLLKIKL